MKVQKNQTVKHVYTIIIRNDLGDVVDMRSIEAESPREAIVKAYPTIFDKEK